MNKQSKRLRKNNISSVVVKGGSTSLKDFKNNELPGLTFKEFPAGSQPSKRRTPYGLKLVKSDREIVYPQEYKNRVKK